MKMASGLYHGEVEAEVGKILLQHFQQLPAFASAMVLSIDSSREPSDVAAILSHYGIESRLDAGAVLLTAEQFYRAVFAEVFAGFDQVWLLKHDSPKESIHLSRDHGVVEACMKEPECVLAMSDLGYATGYATWDGAFATLIDAECLKQQM